MKESIVNSLLAVRKSLTSFIIMCLCLMISSGCSSKITRIEEKENLQGYLNEINQIEYQNILDDTLLFTAVLDNYFKEQEILKNTPDIVTDERVRISALNFLKYMNDVYKIALDRVNTDLDGLSVTSESYVEYIAMLQSYIIVFNENKEYFKTHFGGEGNEDYYSNEAIMGISMVEKFYTDMILMLTEE